MQYCATAVIAAKGGDRLKQELLPSFARPGHLSTLAFSESGSGGHFYAPVSEVCQKRLSASKSFVTSAGEADSYVVSARKTGAAGPTESNLYLISKSASGLAAQGRFEGQTHGSSRSSILCSRCLFRIRRSASLWNSKGSGSGWARAQPATRNSKKQCTDSILWLSRFNSR
jgi:alkylation response protein AidB-like acyl-CoA dehydrogenase